MKKLINTKIELINLIKDKFSNYFFGEYSGDFICFNGENIFKLITK